MTICPACRGDFPTATDFRQHLPECRRNDPPDMQPAQFRALRAKVMRLRDHPQYRP